MIFSSFFFFNQYGFFNEWTFFSNVPATRVVVVKLDAMLLLNQ